MVITNAIHNNPPTFSGAYLIYWQLARKDKVKELINSHTRIEANSKQVIAII